MIDLGQQRLRDIARPVNVFPGPCTDGLRTEFPPLPTVGCDAGEPAGADYQLRRSRVGTHRVGAALKAHRLVTLTGVGGWARPGWRWSSPRGRRTIPDGVWLIELAPVGDPAAVPDAVAAGSVSFSNRG